MNRRAVLISILTALFAGATSSRAAARDAPEVEVVRRALVEAEAASASARAAGAIPTERASTLLERYVDVVAFEERVFSDLAPSLTAAQKKTLSDAFRPLLVRRIALRLRTVPLLTPAIDPPREDSGETRVRLVFRDAGG